MAAKKTREQLRQVPLLSAVARKLGQAAGTVTNLAHELLAHPVAKNGSAEPSSALATTVRKSKNRRTNKRTAAQPVATRSVPHPTKRTSGKSKRAVATRTRWRG
jgi:hypothetical protein